MNIITRHAVLSAVFAAALVGCDKTDETIDPPAVSHEVGLRRLASCDDLKTRVTDSIIESVVQGYGFRGYPGGVLEDAVDAPAADNTAGGDGGGGESGPSSWTGTNNQEEGVEELDLVQTDGEHLYVAQDKWLQIVDSFPAESASLQASVQLDGYARGLFQADATTLVVVEDLGGETTPDGAWIPLTRARIVDVSDPAAPVTSRTVDLEGWLVDARMIDTQVYLVLQQPMDVPYTVWEGGYTALNNFTWPSYDAGEAAWAAARVQARALVAPVISDAMAALSSDDLLPQARANGGAFSSMYQCGDLYEPAQNTQLAMLGVSQIDPSSGLTGASGILSDGWIVYASQTALYVAQTSWWWFGWSDEAVSHIHKFDLSGAAPAYVASGEVTGWLYDQFAMSEFNGYLRAVSTQFGVSSGGVAVSDGGVATDVAAPETTDSPDATGGSTGGSDGSTGSGEAPADAPADQPTDTDTKDPVDPIDPVDPPAVDPNAPANDVWVLGDDGAGSLAQIGHVGGIAPGETIQSARLMGDRGYMVTFRQTDPLFVLDLSDPAAPAVTGSLQMPGYSAYLHPLDADHLIGVGMVGLETGTITGLGIHLFDVSDPTAPALIQSYAVDSGENAWAWSEALWDHHAFTFRDDVLTIPAFSQRYDEATQTFSGFSGAIAFHVSPDDGIYELGRVDHSSLVAPSECIWDILYNDGTVTDGGTDPDVDAGGTDTGAATEPGRDDGTAVEPGNPGAPDAGTDPAPDQALPAEWSYCQDGYYWYAEVRRTRYIDDYLYTISNYGVKVNELYDPSIQVGEVLFHPAQ